MSDYMFGTGRGHLSKTAAKAAKAAGGILVNHTDPGCSCGHGCRGNCPANMRHWFAVDNRGEPFNSEAARKVMAAVRKAATKTDLEKLDK